MFNVNISVIYGIRVEYKFLFPTPKTLHPAITENPDTGDYEFAGHEIGVSYDDEWAFIIFARVDMDEEDFWKEIPKYNPVRLSDTFFAAFAPKLPKIAAYVIARPS